MKRHLGKLTVLLCGAVLWAVSVVYQSPNPAAGFREWCRVLSNGALIPGVLFLGIGLMSWIAGTGQFDGFRYSMSSLYARLRGEKKQYASYYDYIHRQKKPRGSSPLLLPGLFFLAAAVILTLLYYL